MKRQSRTLKLPELILIWAKKYPAAFSSSQVVDRFKVSRQTAARVLKSLIVAGKLSKEGSTQMARYKLAAKVSVPAQLKLKKHLKGLAEDRVFEEVRLKMHLNQRLGKGVQNIANYAFSEMLNNAIDHSGAKQAEIQVSLQNGIFDFVIRDRGIGAFENIKKTFQLKNEFEAVEHLLKGKQTTYPQAHSGQGIFFTSKIADLFELRSGHTVLKINNQIKDVFISTARLFKGTEVHFQLGTHSTRSLRLLFSEYANDSFEFDRTKIPIVAMQNEGAISRSQARRLTMGLEKFDRIILDFAKVKEIGQGFCDEIFRVYQDANLRTVIETRNTSPAVDFMIRRARSNK